MNTSLSSRRLGAVARALALCAAGALAVGGAMAQSTTTAPAAKPAATPAAAPAAKPASASLAKLCDTCGLVTDVNSERRKGSGGAAGIVAGAAVGGLLGNQVGEGTGNTVATVGGAVAGGIAGNEIQKRMTAKKFFVTYVTMKDGSKRKFEQEAQPGWRKGDVVKVDANGKLSKV